ncbi:hypothetical protein P7C73_g97, partial [Tremellales sp. Uapishka_1]
MHLPPARRPHVLLALLFSVASLFFIHTIHPFPFLASPRGKHGVLGIQNEHSRLDDIQQTCEAENPFVKEYGRGNLRLSRAYEGSQHRIRQFLHKALRGEDLVISAIGGSVTKGHHVEKNEIWFSVFGEWLDEFLVDAKIKKVNGAQPATGSDYYSFCFPLHIPLDSDLVLVELAINDHASAEHVENMENLIRGLLALPNNPAVILVEALAFANGGMGGGGGRMHLPVAQYYDVPVINQRHPLATHFARYPQLLKPYFSDDGWGGPDTRHVGVRGHRDLGLLVASFIQDVACEMVSEDHSKTLSPTGPDIASLSTGDLEDPIAEFPDQAQLWRDSPKDGETLGELMPGMWMSSAEYGIIPRMGVLEGWNPNLDHQIPPFRPTCLSTRSPFPQYKLTPTYSQGWSAWTHPDFLDKPYLVANETGALVRFEMETVVGVVKIYFLRSKSFGLGNVECWVDSDRDRAVNVLGWWDNGWANIGQFATLRNDLSPGLHTISCEHMGETNDPDGGKEFRMISMMR